MTQTPLSQTSSEISPPSNDEPELLTHKNYHPSLDEMKLWWDRLVPYGDIQGPYVPSEAQLAIHLDPWRIKLVAGGERSGKSLSATMHLLPHLPYTRLGWIVAADYNQARAEFLYLRDALTPLGAIAKVSIPVNKYQPCSMTLVTGAVIETVTGADENKIGMKAPDWIIAAEAAQLSHSMVLRLIGRLAEKRGWLLMEGTFESSQDWYADTWHAWQTPTKYGEKSYSLPTWSNTAIFPGGWDDPMIVTLRERFANEPGRFMERHGGVPSLPTNVVFPEFSFTRHVGHFPFNPRLPVEVAIDPGYAGAYALLAIQRPDTHKVYVVDEIYARKWQARQVIKEVKTRPWFTAVNPRKAGVIDIAGKQHQGMQSHVEAWAAPDNQGGAGWTLEYQYVPIAAGIERYRSFLSDPVTGDSRIFYNASTTVESQREHKLYRYREDGQGRPQVEEPVDRDNHSLKAIAYYLVRRFGWAEGKRRKTRKLVFTTGDNHGSYFPYPGEGARLAGRKRGTIKRVRRRSRVPVPFRI